MCASVHPAKNYDEDESAVWVQCQACESWFHAQCTDIPREDLDTLYVISVFSCLISVNTQTLDHYSSNNFTFFLSQLVLTLSLVIMIGLIPSIASVSPFRLYHSSCNIPKLSQYAREHVMSGNCRYCPITTSSYTVNFSRL